MAEIKRETVYKAVIILGGRYRVSVAHDGQDGLVFTDRARRNARAWLVSKGLGADMADGLLDSAEVEHGWK